jgi:hypothetical protein
MKGWNYMVRLYRPRPEILNGSCKFPEGSRQDEQKIRSVPRRREHNPLAVARE